MGWGCYRHEWDAESEEWKTKMELLCETKLRETPRTWGRDGQICPACWEDLCAEYDALTALLQEMEGTLEASRKFCALVPPCDHSREIRHFWTKKDVAAACKLCVARAMLADTQKPKPGPQRSERALSRRGAGPPQ